MVSRPVGRAVPSRLQESELQLVDCKQTVLDAHPLPSQKRMIRRGVCTLSVPGEELAALGTLDGAESGGRSRLSATMKIEESTGRRWREERAASGSDAAERASRPRALALRALVRSA